MLRGLYTAAQGLKVQQQRHDISVNNLSNISTPGFKSDEALVRSFPEELLYFMGKQGSSHIPEGSRSASMLKGQPPAVGYLSQGVTVEEVVARFDQGSIRETGRSLDLAIVDGDEGQKGFIAVQKELNGEQVNYTRAGNFRLREVDGVQYLATQDGEFVLQRQGGDPNDLQPIALSSEDIVVYADGSFAIEDPGFLPIEGQIHLVQFANEQLPGLIKEGHGLYRIDEQFLGAGFAPDVAGNIQVRQFFIEGSNVDATRAVVDMMTAQRSYEANQKIIQSYDRNLDKIVNEIGRV